RTTMGALGIVGLLLLAWVAMTNGDAVLAANSWSRGNMGLLAALCYALVVVCAGSLRIERNALLAICAGAGALSYGLYIFHNAARNLAVGWWGNGATTALLALIMSVAAASAGHWLIEQPLRQWGRVWSARLRDRTKGGAKGGSGISDNPLSD
ncbi:MAG TPA: hypothetical protein VMH83_08505, partial [Candidatus Acidoferrum sp.]|nr:hypothetical protein [Candidatus Acidoferrum sp.]